MPRRCSRKTSTAASEIEISLVRLVFVLRTAPSGPSCPSIVIVPASVDVRPGDSACRPRPEGSQVGGAAASNRFGQLSRPCERMHIGRSPNACAAAFFCPYGGATPQGGSSTMATRDMTTDDASTRASRPRVTQREETKASFLTTEFWAMVGAVAAILVAAAQADNFDAPRAWTLVAAVVIGYMVSRGLAKSGSDHRDRDADRI
jgi:hypothetical protein